MAKLYDDVSPALPVGDDAIKEILRLALLCESKILLLVEHEHTGRCLAKRRIDNDPDMLRLANEFMNNQDGKNQ